MIFRLDRDPYDYSFDTIRRPLESIRFHEIPFDKWLLTFDSVRFDLVCNVGRGRFVWTRQVEGMSERNFLLNTDVWILLN